MFPSPLSTVSSVPGDDDDAGSDLASTPDEYFNEPDDKYGLSDVQWNDAGEMDKDMLATSDSIGTLPEEVYDRTLAWWRAGLRRFLVQNVKRESQYLARLQERVRTPWLDNYFVYSSSLGTHTFFMTALPAFFFFGYQETGRGLIFVLALGVYLSSFIKDLVCAPRPFAPPVARLTIGSHHLEYGFPSTHSTNSVSVALYVFSHLLAALRSSTVSVATYSLAFVLLLVYVLSIVMGRLYTGMHSLTDCAVGVLLGTFVWAVHSRYWLPVEEWVVRSHWLGPVLVTITTVVLVNQHPQPVDDCPCFEDAIAFVSVVAGILLARWAAVQYGFDDAFLVSRMPGTSGLSLTNLSRGWADVGIWWTFALLKLAVGIIIIFAWRLVAKTLLLNVLPPAYRALAHLFTLPHRRFYTPATEYAHVRIPPEKQVLLHPIPSVMDLPGELRLQDRDGEARATARSRYSYFGQDLKARNGTGMKNPMPSHPRNYELEENAQLYAEAEKSSSSPSERTEIGPGVVKHYDADVITKVIVYSGIAILASELVPVMFEVIGWGVHP